RIAGPGGCFEVPDNTDLRVDTADLIINLTVRVHTEHSFLVDVGLEVLWVFFQPRDLLKLRRSKRCLPTSCARDVDVGFMVDDFAGETLPLNQVHKVRSHIDDTFSLLLYVKEPGRSNQRRTRYSL